MPDPIKIRAQQKGDFSEIRILMIHPMETGQRKDPKTGKNQSAHFIQSFSVTINGKPVIEGQTGTSVARNPVFVFKIKGTNAGDKVSVSWMDNKGDKRSDESLIA